MPIPGSMPPPPIPPHRILPRGVPPHVTLNAGNQDMLSTNTSSSGLQEGRQNQGVSRSLIPRNSRSPVSPSFRNQRSAGAMYAAPTESSELLLPPPGRDHRLRTDSPSSSGPRSIHSRRSSWSSEMGSFTSPFDDSGSPSRAGSDEDCINTQTVSEKFAIMPSAGLLLFPEDVEKDDWLHNPDPNEKEERECDVFSRRGIVNVCGLGLLTLGLMFLFVGYPVITFYRNTIAKSTKSANPCDSTQCLDVGKVPLLKNIRRGLIDPDTPQSAMSKKSSDGSTLNLVFSDEFKTPNRTFYPGDDPYFQAMDLWYGVTEDLEWYDPDAVTTQDSTLVITFDEFQNHNLNYRSGMLQSWNQLCFKGGMLEASISLPGKGQVSGFWPGFWAMGNLGRPGFASTTHGLWPYSYWDKCDAGITKNQSTPDGLSYLPGMRMPACTCKGEDHPTPGKSRSAPEIDAIEASTGFLGPGQANPVGTASQSAQFAPFDIWYQPNYDFVELYNSSVTQMNGYRGGPYQQALSGLTTLNNNWYDGNQYQTYAFEYTPGSDGYIVWYVGQDKTWKLDARSIGPNGNIGQRVMPEEPMSVVANFGMSKTFAPIDLVHLKQLFPSHMRLDYIRIYQKPGSESVTCDPPGYETTAYIKNHADVYSNPNVTSWDQTSYQWPKNSFVDGCQT